MKSLQAFLSIVVTTAIAGLSPGVVLGASPSLAMADTGSDGASGAITIISPLDHQVVDSPNDTTLHYYVQSGANAGQLHLILDGGPPVVLKDVTGCPCIVKLPHLASGRHTLTLREAAAAPGTAGSENSIMFTVIGGLR